MPPPETRGGESRPMHTHGNLGDHQTHRVDINKHKDEAEEEEDQDYTTKAEKEAAAATPV